MLLQLDFTRRLLPRGACSCILYSMGVGYMDQEVELLAPAGGIAAFHAAVRGGADAVYLGLQSFNARRGADNFTIDTFADACAFAHLRGVNVYVTLNTAILPGEVDSAMETARQAYRAGADAFIVQDIGIASELSRTLPQARLHISTQMNTHNEAGMRAAAQLGAARVTLARELSLPEIEHLAKVGGQLGLEIETFAHGALCVCYSGQCFMSSLIGGRSANRGLCAQACRLPYALHNVAKNKPLPAPGDHLLSPQDLCSIDLLPDLVRAGVASLKIEGRMKSPEYVYAVTSAYRAALDRVLAARDAARESGLQDWTAPGGTEQEHAQLAEAFSRGFTTAYLEGKRGNEIMSYGRPNNRGVFIGRVASVKNGKAAVACERPIVAGDVLEFWTNKGHFAYTVSQVDTDRNGNLLLAPERAVGKGDRVFRVRSAEAAFVDDDRLPRIQVQGHARLRIGQPLRIEFCLADNPADPRALRGARKRFAEGELPVGVAEGQQVEPARTKAVGEDDVRAHIDRLGQTPFSLVNLDIDMDEGVGIGFSQLHHVRAEALDSLEQALLEGTFQRPLPRVEAGSRMLPAHAGGVHIAVLATNPACARAAKRAGADEVYVPAVNLAHGQATIAGQLSETAEQASYPKACAVVLPVADHDDCELTREQACGFDAWRSVHADQPVMAESLGQLVRAHEAGSCVEVGPHLPVTNALALQTAARLGAKRVWLSPELNLAQISDLAKESPVELGLTVIGRQELMTTEHCMLMSQGPCAQECATCARRKSPHFLKDRKGYDFPVISDQLGRSHLYNSVQLDVAHAIPDIVQAGITWLLVDSTLMNVQETTQAVQRVVRARNVAHAQGTALPKEPGCTSGHLFRGVQ